ncbi:MAG: 2Fe-2S iron-sulfur cluster binding domain-containing protein [Mesorhizobium sp.]|nr:2Fe-2S iron-sulfur cluster binding domain-containing protein [Mesorhizobium sp.]
MTQSITVTWIVGADTRIVVDVPVGQSLMEAALNAGVPGIRGECGGALACATCHVVVEHCPSVLEAGLSAEQEMLEFAEVPAREASRLSCQIRAGSDIDGIVVRVPQ